jgi:hypothetical protein
MKYLFIALARSGHHAIINWFCQHLRDASFHNNCNQELQYRKLLWYGKRTHKVYSFENFDLRGYPELYSENDPFDHVIIVHRDPFNWIASSLKKNRAPLDEPFPCGPTTPINYLKWWCNSLSRIDMYCQYMEQTFGEKDHLGRYAYDINYNLWFFNKAYRKRICDDFGLEFTDAGINDVMRIGKGSSFDGTSFNGRANEMEVLTRWKKYENDPRFWSLVTDPIKHYAKRYFNMEIP